jgi:hypothetical protein
VRISSALAKSFAFLACVRSTIRISKYSAYGHGNRQTMGKGEVDAKPWWYFKTLFAFF